MYLLKTPHNKVDHKMDTILKNQTNSISESQQGLIEKIIQLKRTYSNVVQLSV
jgi:uncharacterized membrane protein YgaE (UPF0421/DUF939 family)